MAHTSDIDRQLQIARMASAIGEILRRHGYCTRDALMRAGFSGAIILEISPQAIALLSGWARARLLLTVPEPPRTPLPNPTFARHPSRTCGMTLVQVAARYGA